MLVNTHHYQRCYSITNNNTNSMQRKLWLKCCYIKTFIFALPKSKKPFKYWKFYIQTRDRDKRTDNLFFPDIYCQQCPNKIYPYKIFFKQLLYYKTLMHTTIVNAKVHLKKWWQDKKKHFTVGCSRHDC